jgi:glutamate N-acetyltransferase/amino-acid N-acetyltransferase
MDDLAGSLGSGADEAGAALEAIMTTDTRKKQIAVEFVLPDSGGTAAGAGSGASGDVSGASAGIPVRIGAMVKGSGMIHPNMATMIAVICTDAAISAPLLDKALRSAVNRSFNRLSIDGDMSTNDMALIMANGAAGNPPIESEGPAFEAFAGALEDVCICLTRQMARDGEGATKLVTVSVCGAASEEDAAHFAKSVAGSSLVKAACFGADANWGRVLCALGYAGISFRPEGVHVSFASKAGSIEVCKNGGPENFSEDTAKKILLEDEIEINISMGNCRGEAKAWGCDLTYDYVKINGDYRT